MGKFDNVDEWRQRYIAAKREGLSALQFRAKWNLTDSSSYCELRKVVNDPSIMNFEKKKRGRKGPYNKKPSEPIYQRLRLDPPPSRVPVIIEKPRETPIFCLVVAYESREAALKAMGQL